MEQEERGIGVGGPKGGVWLVFGEPESVKDMMGEKEKGSREAEEE